MTTSLIFLGFVVSSQGIHVDEEKVRAIRDWPVPKSATEVRSFHGLATFYQWFICNFGILIAPMIDCLKKKGHFIWIDEADRVFALIKEKLTNAPRFSFSKFWEGVRGRVRCLRSGYWSSTLARKETHCLSQWKVEWGKVKAVYMWIGIICSVPFIRVMGELFYS